MKRDFIVVDGRCSRCSRCGKYHDPNSVVLNTMVKNQSSHRYTVSGYFFFMKNYMEKIGGYIFSLPCGGSTSVNKEFFNWNKASLSDYRDNWPPYMPSEDEIVEILRNYEPGKYRLDENTVRS